MPEHLEQQAAPAKVLFRWYSERCMDAYFSLWGNGSGILTALLLGLVAGTPLAVIAADRGLGEAVVWGLMWGCMVYGVLLLACMTGAVLLFPLDLVRWTVHWIRRRRS